MCYQEADHVPGIQLVLAELSWLFIKAAGDGCCCEPQVFTGPVVSLGGLPMGARKAKT